MILSEPMLQNPGPDHVRVVWFTEAAGERHRVFVGPRAERVFEAQTAPMTRLLEDRDSRFAGAAPSARAGPRPRAVFRHEAVVTGLSPGERLPYAAVSEIGGRAFRSSFPAFLGPLPRPGEPLTLLLTSDHQGGRMCAANLQKAAETLGTVDAVLFAGDLADHPNRASEWFDGALPDRPPFFAALQGTAARFAPGAAWRGGAILQSAPLYACLGNHEYAGRWRLDPGTDDPANGSPVSIDAMQGDAQPRWLAELRWARRQATGGPAADPAFRARWIADNSFECVTYREMWSLPEGPEGTAYWAQRFGDVFLIALDANRVWRSWQVGRRGKFGEPLDPATGRVVAQPAEWGFGDFTFRPFGPGSRQYAWLEEVLRSPDCRSARFRIVLTHQTPFGLGMNTLPVQAMQQVTVELAEGARIGPFPASDWPRLWPLVEARLRAGEVRQVSYDYPLAGDLWRNHIEPLLLEAGVHLVLCGHSHLWQRSRVGDLHYLETSNVGNSFGARWPAPGSSPAHPGRPADPPARDPHGRPMASPTIFNPMRALEGAPADLPFVASNLLTVFSVLETRTGLVSSWVYDTRAPGSPARRFDAFRIG